MHTDTNAPLLTLSSDPSESYPLTNVGAAEKMGLPGAAYWVAAALSHVYVRPGPEVAKEHVRIYGGKVMDARKLGAARLRYEVGLYIVAQCLGKGNPSPVSDWVQDAIGQAGPDALLWLKGRRALQEVNEAEAAPTPRPQVLTLAERQARAHKAARVESRRAANRAARKARRKGRA